MLHLIKIDASRRARPVPLTCFCFQATSLFRQQPDVTFMTRGRHGSEESLFLHETRLAAVESLQENHRYCILAVIKYQCLLFWCFWECGKHYWSIPSCSAHTCRGGGGCCLYGGVSAHSSRFSFLFIEMWAKLKGSLLEELHLWTQDDAIKAGRYWKAKHQTEARAGSHKS